MYTHLPYFCLQRISGSGAFLPKKQESCAVARKLHDTAAVLFGLKFADNIQYKLRVARLQSSKHTGTKQNLMQNGHSRSCVLVSVERL